MIALRRIWLWSILTFNKERRLSYVAYCEAQDVMVPEFSALVVVVCSMVVNRAVLHEMVTGTTFLSPLFENNSSSAQKVTELIVWC
jgi:hypothetical protein